jgi:hypothetical protein
LITTLQTTNTPDQSFLSQTKPKTKRRRREPSPRRRPLKRHKEIRQAIKALKAVQSKAPRALAHYFEATIRSLQTAIAADVIITIEREGLWSVKAFMEHCLVSRRVMDAIFRDLEAQGAVKKSKFYSGRKGRPPYQFQATPRALEIQKLIQNGKK